MSKINLIKISFILLSAIFSFLIWIRFEKALDFITMLDLGSAVIILILTSALFLLSLFLFSDRTPFIVLGSFLLVFLIILGFTIEYLLMTLFVFLLYYYAKNRLYKGVKDNSKITFHPVVFYGAPTITTILALLISLASYSYPFSISEFKFSPKTFEYVEPATSSVLSIQFSFYKKGMTIDDFLTKTISEQTGIDEKIIKTRYKKEIEKQRDKMSKDLNIDILGGDTINDILSKTANMYISKFLTPNQKIIPIFIALTVFFTIKSFSFILNRLVVLLMWFVYKILVKFKLIKIKSTSIEKEILEIG